MAAKTTTSVLPAAKALLLVLVGLVAAHAQVANEADPMGIMRRSLLTSSAGSICSAEATDCIGDESCVDCFTSLSEGMSSCKTDEVTSCGAAQDAFCCTLEEQSEECKSNSASANYFGGWILIDYFAELMPFGGDRLWGREVRSTVSCLGNNIVQRKMYRCVAYGI